MTDSPTRTRRRWWRRVLPTLGWLGVAVGVAGVAARTAGIGWQPAIVLASFAPFAAVAALVGAVFLLARRNRPGVVVGLVAVVWTVVVQAPLFVGRTSATGTPLTVLQANLMVGGADAAALVERVRTHHVDVLTVEELTADAVARLSAAGLDDVLPHHLVVPFPGGAGAGIWSALPLRDTARYDDFSFQMLGATVDPPDAAPVRVVAVHLLPPWPYPSNTWLAELRRLRTLLTAPGPDGVVAAGDFNATLDHPRFRALLRDGFHDATEQTGAGYLATYPTDEHVPPVLALDHVVARGVSAVSARSLDLPGSDHRALLVTLAVPG